MIIKILIAKPSMLQLLKPTYLLYRPRLLGQILVLLIKVMPYSQDQYIKHMVANPQGVQGTLES